MNFDIRNFIICIVALATLGGCAKKQRARIPLPKIARTAYKKIKNGVKLKIRHVTPTEFESIYPKGLGKYTIVKVGDGNTINKKAVCAVQGSIKNNSLEDIYIARSSISLPVIPVRHTYHRGIFEQMASSLLLIGGILVFPLSLSTLGGAMGLFSIFLLPVGIVSIIPGATLVPIEHLKHIDRKAFAYGVMLPEEPYKIEPKTEFNWFMLIPTNEYTSNFTITCTNKDGLAASVFDVAT